MIYFDPPYGITFSSNWQNEVGKREFAGQSYAPGATVYRKTTPDGMRCLAATERLEKPGAQVSYVRFIDDYPVQPIANLWDYVMLSSRSQTKRYVVQTVAEGAFEALAGTTSLPFKASPRQGVAIKVIDPRGNEVMRVHRLDGKYSTGGES